MKQYIIPAKCFINAVKTADKKDYDITVGLGIFIYDNKTETLMSPVSSESINLKKINYVSVNKESSSYLIKYNDENNKVIKRTICFKRKIKTKEILSNTKIYIDKKDTIQKLIQKAVTHKLVLWNNQLMKYSEKSNSLLYCNSKKRINLSLISQGEYDPITNDLMVYYKNEVAHIRFIVDFTGDLVNEFI